MPAKTTLKSLSSADKERIIQEIREEMQVIGNRSTWLLGFLAIIVAGLTSFVFQGLNALLAVSNFPLLKLAVLVLLVVYLAITLLILLMLMLSFVSSSIKYKSLDNRLEAYEKKLEKLEGLFVGSIISVIGSLFAVCAFAIYFSYFLYV